MRIQLIRHATMLIEYAGRKLLLDPMLSAAGTLPATPTAANDWANPLVELPVPVEKLLEADAVLVTHGHRDHLDAAAEALLPKEMPLFCQPPDVQRLETAGFKQAIPVEGAVEWRGIRLTRTGGKHGRGAVGASMGPVSGFVLQAPGEPTLYIAGDTVWCRDVRYALITYRPDAAVLFAGAAKLRVGGPITMTERDIARVCEARPDMQVLVAHLEAWNHCGMTRKGLRTFLQRQGLADRAAVPENGETLSY